MFNEAPHERWLPQETPRDILYDAARVVVLLDIRQMLGKTYASEQEELTKLLIDYDMQQNKQDYLIPRHDSPLWDRLNVPDDMRNNIRQRVLHVPKLAVSQRLRWVVNQNGDEQIWIGPYKLTPSKKDIATLESRWKASPKEPREDSSMRIEMARLLALYSVLDNPTSFFRSGVHLALHPAARQQCEYELFASPLNAVVKNGCFASKWPHLERRFGSMGSYPSVIDNLPKGAIVEINPPFTDAVLEDVMKRLEELKAQFRLQIAIPIWDKPWRGGLSKVLPGHTLLNEYWDSSAEKERPTLTQTVFWEDPDIPPLEFQEPDRPGDFLAFGESASDASPPSEESGADAPPPPTQPASVAQPCAWEGVFASSSSGESVADAPPAPRQPASVVEPPF